MSPIYCTGGSVLCLLLAVMNTVTDEHGIKNEASLYLTGNGNFHEKIVSCTTETIFQYIVIILP